MHDFPEHARDELFRLRADYLAALCGKLEELEAIARSASDGITDSEIRTALKRLEVLSHKLAGSSGTFGLDALSRGAIALESACGALVDTGAQFLPEKIAHIRRLTMALRLSTDCDRKT